MSHNHTLIMENWRSFLQELDVTPSSGISDISSAQYVSKALSNQEKASQFEFQRAFNPIDRQWFEDTVSKILDSDLYGKFVAYFNPTLGWLLPNLPRDSSKKEIEKFGIELCVFLVFASFGKLTNFSEKTFSVLKMFFEIIKKKRWLQLFTIAFGAPVALSFLKLAIEAVVEKWDKEQSFKSTKKFNAGVIQSLAEDVTTEMFEMIQRDPQYKFCKSRKNPNQKSWNFTKDCISN